MGVSGGVEPPQVGEEHAWEDDGGDRQPRAFLVVGWVDGRELQLDGEVVVVQEEVVVRLPQDDVDDDHDNQLQGDRCQEGHPCHLQRGELEDLGQAYADADAEDVVKDYVAVREEPAEREAEAYQEGEGLHGLEFEGLDAEQDDG